MLTRSIGVISVIKIKLLYAMEKFLTSITLGTINEAAVEFVRSGSKVEEPCFYCTNSLWPKISIRSEQM